MVVVVGFLWLFVLFCCIFVCRFSLFLFVLGTFVRFYFF